MSTPNTILDALKDHWADQEALTDLVPAARVVVGPPNPGGSLPRVGLMSVTIAEGLRTSSGRYPSISVELAAQSDDLETLEALREAIRDHLEDWSTERYGTMQLSGVQMQIGREEDSPSRVWVATATLTFDAITL